MFSPAGQARLQGGRRSTYTGRGGTTGSAAALGRSAVMVVPVSVAVGLGQFLCDAADDDLGVAEEHEAVVGEVEFVLDAGEAAVHGARDGHDGAGAVGVEDGHAVDRAGLVVAGGGVDDVVGA